MGQVQTVTVTIKELTLAELQTMQTDLGVNDDITANVQPIGGNLADLPTASVTLSSTVPGNWVAADTTVLNTILGKHDGV